LAPEEYQEFREFQRFREVMRMMEQGQGDCAILGNLV
jgi:hypothetical protein